MEGIVTADRTLSRRQARAFYDWFGRWQDTQAFYEGPTLDTLVALGAFDEAQAVFEVGCGTGWVADRLLRDHCPPDTRYVGVDLSATMVRLARHKLEAHGDRAQVFQTSGAFSYDVPDGSQDRVLATYVVDLLSPEDIHSFFEEAHRLLAPDGRLCLAGLTTGRSLLGRATAALWTGAHAIWPLLVGGCRPLRMRRFLDHERWRELQYTIVRAWGVPSEVLIVTPRNGAGR